MAGQRVMPNPKTASFVKRRPAESVAAGGGAAAILFAILGGDYPAAAFALITVFPAVFAFVVDHGGVRGLLERVWRGN